MLLGLDNNYTRGARRLIAFAVAKSSYETAAFQLKEFGCITVSHQTVSNLVSSLSDEVQSKLANNAGVCKAFQEAKGDTEFTTDGAFIKIRYEDKSHCWMECLDIFHASEHISGCGKALFKDAEQQRCWFEDKRMLLLRKGFCGVNEELQRLLKSDIFDADQQDEVRSLQTYLCNNRERLSYSERLFAGRAIGSGVVEGAGGSGRRRR
ncbi:hypothetical protein FACS18942_01410 [Planctomycetales bacterium]|nr:hypothetical protein FACS18942_01410 [Planctomycetales bacterium]GHT34907.1 hypothetical protein FACS189427_03110 [Planctomycetales bacterium]